VSVVNPSATKEGSAFSYAQIDISYKYKMEGKKVVFFEVEPWEQEYLKDKLQGKVDLEFFSHRLSYDNVHEAAQADYISSFIYSDLSHQVIDHLRKLKGIATMSVGVDHIDVEEAHRRGVIITNVPSYGPNTVAEHAMALLLSISRRIVESVERTRHGLFDYNGLAGWDLKGKTIGVIGTGKIGAHVVRIANGLDMKIIAYDPFPSEELTSKFGAEYMTLEKLLSQSDVITLHVPLTDKNKHMLSDKEFKQMKKGMTVINTARGALIDPEALVEALNNGTVKHAGIDVFEQESLLTEERQLKSRYFKLQEFQSAMTNHVLLHHPKVTATPHNAFNSEESIKNILDTTVDNVIGLVTGDPVNVVDK